MPPSRHAGVTCDRASMFPDLLTARLERLIGRFRRAPDGRVRAIFVADAAGVPMRACEQTLTLVDQGLADDRYALGRGFGRLTDRCQATLNPCRGSTAGRGPAWSAARCRSASAQPGRIGAGRATGPEPSDWGGAVDVASAAPALRVSGSGRRRRYGQGARTLRRAVPARCSGPPDPSTSTPTRASPSICAIRNPRWCAWMTSSIRCR